MNHRTQYTSLEADSIRELLTKCRKGVGTKEQKPFRDTLRKMGFYITDYDKSRLGFIANDFNQLVDNGAISIIK